MTPKHIGALRVSASGCTLEAIDGLITPGLVAFTALNETDALAAFNIARLADGYTYEQFAEHIKEEIRLAKAGKPGLGHPDFAVPLFEVLLDRGEMGRMVGTLTSGRYVLTCARVYREAGELRPAAPLGPLDVG